MIAFALRRAGYECAAAPSAEVARASILAVPPLLIVLDWMLPGISGLDFAPRLKQDQLACHIPIIMLTARGEEADKIRGLESGADDYITQRARILGCASGGLRGACKTK